MTAGEQFVTINGLELAVKTWGNPDLPPVIALHGWLDNAATFDTLAPLVDSHYWITPDLSGHGLSAHRGIAVDYSLSSYCIEVMALADSLSLDRFVLVGHSMGGGVANLLAGLYPERIEKLVLLDVIGTLTTPAEDTLTQMRKGLDQRLERTPRKAGLYATRDKAVEARAKKGIDLDAAQTLGRRGIAKQEQGYSWCHDQRLILRSLLSMTDDQLVPFMEAVCCPVLVIGSQEAVIRQQVIEERVALVKKIRTVNLPGGHHQHLDGDVPGIAALLKEFLSQS
jgi:pimeloyl-ACP methyl ester carboxylesterase